VIPAVNASAAANIHRVLGKAVLEFYSAGRQTKKLLTAEIAEKFKHNYTPSNLMIFFAFSKLSLRSLRLKAFDFVSKGPK
jgi:hypothetical protein